MIINTILEKHEMEDQVKTREQLLIELATMRQRLAELEAITPMRQQMEEKLQRVSAERFFQVVLAISNHIYVTEITADGQRQNLYLSPDIEFLTGYPITKLMFDWSFWSAKLIHPDDRAAAAVQAAQLALGQNSEVEYRLVRADGQIVWVRDSVGVEALGSSKIVYGVVTDITERKDREAALAKLLELSRALVTTHDPNLLFDQAIKLAVSIAPAADRGSLQLLDETGETLNTVAISNFDEVLGQTLVFRPDVGIAGHALAQNQTINVPDVLVDKRFIPSDLPLRFRSLLVAPLVVKGRLLGTLSLSSEQVGAFSGADETLVQLIADQVAAALENARLAASQRQAEEWRKAHQFLQATIDALAAHIAILDESGRIVAVNANWRHYAIANNYTAPDYGIGSNYLEVCDSAIGVDAEDGPAVAEGIRQVIAGQRSQFYLEYPAHNLTQKQWYSLRVTRFQNDGSVGAVVAHENVTELKQLEAQFLQMQKMEAVGRLAGGIAHDFNNLLTVITGYSELLLMNMDKNNPFRHDVEQMHQAGERAASLTQQLLIFSRRGMIQPQILNLNTIIENLEKMLRPLIGEDIQLLINLDSTIGLVKADPGQMEQIIMNLVINARDAMLQGGQLIIETAEVEVDETALFHSTPMQPGHYLQLTVSDTGAGMDEETLSHIFEPFYTTKEQGTGLGLSTVYAIVTQSKGAIQVYSEPERGTTFRVYLPLSTEETAAKQAISEGPLTASVKGTETILVVEDEEAVREMSKHALLDQGYQVLEAQNGHEALYLCQHYEGIIHVLLTDLVMPGDMSGRELAEKVKLLLPETKIIYMSGYTDDIIIQHGVLDARVAFLQKPFTPSVLLQRLRQILDT